MVSDTGTSTARARRSLLAARAARDGISTMVETLRHPRPPRIPSTSPLPQSRKHALIPPTEGRAELEARIRNLESLLSARDADLHTLKRRAGRALLKRATADKERNSALALVKQLHAIAMTQRKGLTNLLDDLNVPMRPLASVAKRTREADNADRDALALADEVLAAVDDVRQSLEEATELLVAHPIPPGISQQAEPRHPLLAAATASVRSRPDHDDDAHSVPSNATYSTTAFPEDPTAQLDLLVDLVDILDAKLTSSTTATTNTSSSTAALATLSRAKHTIAQTTTPPPTEFKQIVTERDNLRAQLDAIINQKECLGGEDAALALAARAEAELRDANKEIHALRDRLASLEKIAERAFRGDALSERNAALETELKSAKKTVGRLVQERNALRRTAPSSIRSNASNASKTPGRGNSEAMKRILDWRQRASSENHDKTSEPIAPVPFSDLEGDQRVEDIRPLSPGTDRPDPLPDRSVGRTLGGSVLVKKRRMGALESDSTNTNEAATALSERSLEVGLNDSISAQSLPVRGFLRRHDSFLSAGNVSASGDEITITNNRNIFNSRGTNIEGGLRALLGGS